MIKATYKKLVLKTHPDKFTDEEVKKQKQEEFHKIQQAYEQIGDEESRSKYDAECRLQESRRKQFARAGPSTSSGGTRVEVRGTHYEVRTQAPSDPSFPRPRPDERKYEERKPVYEERKPARTPSYDEDKYHPDRSSSRKYDTYESVPRRSPRSSREKESVKVSTERSRTEAKKSQDKDNRRERSFKYQASFEDDSDEKAAFERDVRRREYERAERRRREDEEDRRAEARKKTEKGRSTEDMSRKHREHDYEKKMYENMDSAASYIRHATSRDADYSRRGSDSVHRSRASRKESSSSRPISSGRDRGPALTEIVDWESNHRIPSLKTYSTAPVPEIPSGGRIPPQRSFTAVETSPSDLRRRKEVSPSPIFRRADTLPVHLSSSSSSRRSKEPSSSRPYDSGYSSTSPEIPFPTIPNASTTTKTYVYPSASGGGVRISAPKEDLELSNGHHTIRREPTSSSSHHRTRSPSPLSRPPLGPNRPSIITPKYVPAAPQPPATRTVVPPPPLGRSATMAVPTELDRGRAKLYGEIDSRPRTVRKTSIDPSKVSYSHRFRPEDVRYSPMERQGDEYFGSARRKTEVY